MVRDKYKNNHAWLFPIIQNNAESTEVKYQQEGIHFYCDLKERDFTITDPISGVRKNVSERIIKTTSQLDFQEGYRISFTEVPINTPTQQDFSIIVSKKAIPIKESNKRSSRIEYEYHIKIT